MIDDKILSLFSSDGWWGGFLLISTLIVLAGVAAEALSFMNCVKRDPKLTHSIAVAAIWILVVGIAGELLGEAKTISIGDQISGLLNDKAGAAYERAAKADGETQELKAKNLVLEAEIAPRKVSDDDVKLLVSNLKPFAGLPISVRSYLGNSEGRRLLMILSTDLSRSGLKVMPGYWNFDASPQMMLLGGLEVNSPPEQKDLADALQKSFSKMDLGIRPQWYAMAAGTPVTLYIGVKPFHIPGITPP